MDIIQNQFSQIWNKKWLQIQHRAPTEYRYHVFYIDSEVKSASRRTSNHKQHFAFNVKWDILRVKRSNIMIKRKKCDYEKGKML